MTRQCYRRRCSALALAAFLAVRPLSWAWTWTSPRHRAPGRLVPARLASTGQVEGGDAKATLLRLVEEFKVKQEETWEMMEREKQVEEASSKKGSKQSSLLEAESFASQRTQLTEELAEVRERIIAAIHAVADGNPTKDPVHGWRHFASRPPSDSPLNGTWKLLFTDAADATFKKGRRGNATTFQEVDAEGGWFINCVDFDNPDAKLKGFRVYVEGEALSGTEIQLSFRKVQLLRRSRFPRWLGKITIPLPNPKLLRNIGRLFARASDKEKGVNQSRRGAGFQLLYVDRDLRIHRTFDGLFFVQRRLA